MTKINIDGILYVMPEKPNDGKYYEPKLIDNKACWVEVSQDSETATNQQIFNAIEFLNNTDWLIIRHRDQVELGLETSLTEIEYKSLLEKRQAKRDLI